MKERTWKEKKADGVIWKKEKAESRSREEAQKDKERRRRWYDDGRKMEKTTRGERGKKLGGGCCRVFIMNLMLM